MGCKRHQKCACVAASAVARVSDLFKLIGAIVVSVALVVAAVVVLTDKSTINDLQLAATGWIGLVAGFWLR